MPTEDKVTKQHPRAITWYEWVNSVKGAQCADFSSLTGGAYLVNRLHHAFDAGVNAVDVKGLVAALERIAAFDDEDASAHLEKTGSYSLFDEPGSVEIARAALAAAKESRWRTLS